MATEKKEAVKPAETKAVAAKAEPAKTTAAKETVKKEAAPKTEVKPAVKKPAAEKAAAPKKETVKKAPVEKKPTTTRKTTAKKAEPKATVVIEYAGKQVVAKDVLAAATKAFKAANKGVEIKTIEIYVKPEENVAYYTVNGDLFGDDYKVEL